MSLSKRQVYENNINRLVQSLTDEEIDKLTRPVIQERKAKLERNFDKFEEEHVKLVSEAPTAGDTAQYNAKYDEVDKIVEVLRDKLAAKDHKLAEAENAARAITPNANAQQTINVTMKSANLLANIDDTWGVFRGEWEKFKDWSEKFRANVHENDVLSAVQKCQLLTKACKGAAAATIGNGNGQLAATEANYNRAWAQLHEVYNDDYLAVLATTKKLINFTPIDHASHSQIRRMLDMIHEVEGELSNHFSIEQWHPIILFTCLFRLDATTYEKWESERTNTKDTENQNPNDQPAAEADENANNLQAEGEQKRPKIPSLTQFKKFLECRARLLTHQSQQARDNMNLNQNSARSRDSSRDSNRHRDRSRQRPTAETGAIPKKYPNRSNDDYKAPSSRAKLPLCRLCGEDHGLFACNQFRDMSLEDKLDLVKRNRLCHVCFHEHAKGECHIKQHACKKCNNGSIHNTQICPSIEAMKRTSLLSQIGKANPEPIKFDDSRKRRGNQGDD